MYKDKYRITIWDDVAPDSGQVIQEDEYVELEINISASTDQYRTFWPATTPIFRYNGANYSWKQLKDLTLADGAQIDSNTPFDIYTDLQKSNSYSITSLFAIYYSNNGNPYLETSCGILIGDVLTTTVPNLYLNAPIHENSNAATEKLIATIGSDTMTAKWRATEPKLVENINGTNTFTFKMYYTYFDEDEMKQVQNPMMKYLINERKVKVLWKDQWYHLVIKNIQEDSNGKSITYTCKDQYINELGKVGYEILLDYQLNNNTGTITELAQTILANTDWQVDTARSDTLNEYIETPVVEGLWSTNATHTSMEGNSILIKNADTVLVPWEDYQTIESLSAGDKLQFIYAQNPYTYLDTNKLLVNGDNFNLTISSITSDSTYWTLNFVDGGALTISKTGVMSTRYRAKRLNNTILTTFDSITEKTVQHYKSNSAYAGAQGVTETHTYYYGPIPASYKYLTFTILNNIYYLNPATTIGSGSSAISLANRVYYGYPYSENFDMPYYTSSNFGTAAGVVHASQWGDLGTNVIYASLQPTGGTAQPAFYAAINGTVVTGYFEAEQEISTGITLSTALNDPTFTNKTYSSGVILTYHENSYAGTSNTFSCTYIYKLNNNITAFYDTLHSYSNISNIPQINLSPTTVQIVETQTEVDYELFAANTTLYKYAYPEFASPQSVTQLLQQPNTFNKLGSWSCNDEQPIVQTYYPMYSASNLDEPPIGYMQVKAGKKYIGYGLKGNKNQFPDGVAYGDKFVVKMRLRADSNGTPGAPIATNLPVSVNIVGTKGRLTQLVTDTVPKVDATNYKYFVLTCIRAFSADDISNDNINFELTINGSGNTTYWIEDCELYKYVVGTDTNGDPIVIDPGALSIQSVYTEKASIYYYSNTPHSLDNIVYVWDGLESDIPFIDDISPIYTTEKVRSISAKESNCFNLIQTLAEKFQCWARFIIDCDPNTGAILSDSEGHPRKYVVFKEQIGQDTGIGFSYGLDLKTISRTIASDQIVTKTMVLDNTNKYGINGFCTITRASQNYPGVNFILDFGYYTAQGLLDNAQLQNDLYGSPNGYYYKLHNAMARLDELDKTYSSKQTELTKQEQFHDSLYTTSLQSAKNQLDEVWLKLYSYFKLEPGASNPTPELAARINTYKDDQAVVSYMSAISTLNSQIAAYEEMVTELEESIAILSNDVETYKSETAAQQNIIKQAHLDFYKKYSRYIQEGTWKSDDYMDDNLYYIDGVSVAYTSSRPQISYTINVIRLSALEEYKNRIFHLGDISFIQDTEFFGYEWVTTEGVGYYKTPYHEKVLVSELTSYFDEPEKDVIKVQNYKTQWEDLFQRITATTQSLKYEQGSYERAADAFLPNGTLTTASIQDTLNSNADLVWSAQNNLVSWDQTGITVRDQTNPSYITKITSGGVFVSIDGGNTWNNAIRGDGINTNLLTAGQINTNEIYIYDGDHPTFRWDSVGIDAFNTADDGSVDFGKFVRFDQYGIYGIDGDAAFAPTAEDQIWANEYAKFGLTWKGFFLRTVANNQNDVYGRIEISSDDDILIVSTDPNGNNPIERIKIGRLYDDQHNLTGFGMKLKNASNETTLETSDNGDLWLRNELSIGAEGATTSHVHIGQLDNYIIKNEQQIHEVINANNNFIVYEDGSIVANNGTFNGIINATGGQIAGFTITDTTLKSNDENLILNSDGTIKAGDIFIDGDSSIITIGDPTGNSYVTISGATNDVKLEGTDGYDHFLITPSHAEFTNTEISAQITTALFSTNATQAVGSSMFFRPSYAVVRQRSAEDTGINENQLVIDCATTAINTNEYMYLIDSDGQVLGNGLQKSAFKITNVAEGPNGTSLVTFNQAIPLKKTEVTTPSNVNDHYIKSVVLLGAVGQLLVGVNSNTSSTGVLFGQGFTFTELEVDAESSGANTVYYTRDSKTPNLYLGNLTQISGVVDNFLNLSGYGLYGDNVYLTGALVTKDGSRPNDPLYAGIYTLNSAESTRLSRELNDTSKVVFWAGAPLTQDGTINVSDAPFQVTQNGSIFAQNGVFTGAVVSDSELRGVNIYGARIHGIGRSEEAHNTLNTGLSFYDISDGIGFFRGDWAGETRTENNTVINDDNSKVSFLIGSDGLKTFFGPPTLSANQDLNNNGIFDVEDFNVKFIEITYEQNAYNTGIIFRTRASDGLEITDNKIRHHNDLTYYEVNDNSLNQYILNTKTIEVQKDSVSMYAKNISFDNTMLYVEVENEGYDLYVGG